jgi:hypothetical protein
MSVFMICLSVRPRIFVAESACAGWSAIAIGHSAYGLPPAEKTNIIPDSGVSDKVGAGGAKGKAPEISLVDQSIKP